MHTIDQFKDAMRSAGYEPPAEITPGKIHRFSANGKRSDTAGFCKMFEDMRGGVFGDFRSGVTHEWQATRDREYTPQERAEWRKAVEQAKREREEQAEQLRAEARAKAQRIWDASPPANDNHPYLLRKGVRAHNVRLSHDAIVVPLKDTDGSLHSLQFIDAEGNKRFLTGGRIKGCYSGIGRPNGKIYIAEGYATAASIHESTGHAVAIAFNAGNLEPVAVALHERYPDLEIVICADNDVNTPGNPGMTKATKAASVVGATVVAPEVGDFNDLALEAGPEAVAAIVASPDNDNQPLDMSPLPDVGSRGKPLSTIENVAAVCNRLGVQVRYNVISKDEEILIPGQSFTIDNRANASLAWLVSWCSRFNMPTDKVGDFITYLADQNPYNPAANWITSRPWDGQGRLQDLYDTITASGEGSDQRARQLKETLMKRWLLSAIAAVFRPDGVSAHGVLVLQGDQYLGKTKWFKSLVPSELRLAQDGMMLRPEDRDSVKQCCSFWLVELGELDATFRKSDIAALKAFLTRDRDVLRRAYAKRESEYARRTVFFASVNPREFLHDSTGNRRYWTIECEAIDHSHGIDMQQVWAEVYELYRRGEGWFLLPDEMAALNQHNQEFEVRDPIEDRLLTRLNWQAPSEFWNWKSVTDVLIDVGIERPEKHHLTPAGQIIRKLNGGKFKKSNGMRLVLAPPRVGEAYSDQPF